MSKPAISTPLRDTLRNLVRLLGFDEAISFVVTLRIWQFLAGPISMLVMAMHVTSEIQGYYYTFSGLMALQIFFELGLHGVIVNHVSHEWTRLTLGTTRNIVGETQAIRRLSAILRFMIVWYSGVAILFAAGVGCAGFVLFRNDNSGVSWKFPWLILVILNGATLWSWALTTFLEGCNLYADVGRLRLVQALVGNIFVWISLIGGMELWSMSIAVGVRLSGDLLFIVFRYRKLFSTLLRTVPEKSFSWSKDVLPLQWRMALRGVFGYLLTGLFVPILFEYHGAIEAGKFGMTWAALSALEQAAHAWIGTRTARYCSLIVNRDFSTLDQEFNQGLKVSSAILAFGVLTLVAVIYCLEADYVPYASHLQKRLLAWDTTLILGVGVAGIHLIRSIGVYLLAHREDPLLKTALSTCVFAGSGIVWAGLNYDVSAMAFVFSGVLWLYAAPLNLTTWNHYRRERDCRLVSTKP